MEELLTAEQVAKWLQVTTRTIRRMVASGTLRPVKIGGIVRFRKADIDGMIAPDPTPTTPEADA